MVESIGLNETLASLYSTISSYQFYYPYHFPQIIEKCKEINCEIEKNQNRYFTEAKNLLTQEKLKNEIRENEKKQRQSFIDSKKIKNSDEVNMIDNVFNKLFHDKIDDEEENWY